MCNVRCGCRAVMVKPRPYSLKVKSGIAGGSLLLCEKEMVGKSDGDILLKEGSRAPIVQVGY